VRARSTLLSACMLVAGCLSEGTADKLETKYLTTLDSWVARGAPISEVQDTVVGTCGKLVMVTVNGLEKAQLTSTSRTEFDFRVDVCTKLTVNRAYPQPEFQDTTIVGGICRRSDVEAFKLLCRRAKL
jgi:hypothetical protein